MSVCPYKLQYIEYVGKYRVDRDRTLNDTMRSK